MDKSKLGIPHIALFLIAVLAVGYSATNYIRDELRYRDIMAGATRSSGPGGGGGGQPGAGQPGTGQPGTGQPGTGQPGTGGAGRSGGRGGFDPERMAQRQLEQMSQQLKLTATQKAQIQVIQKNDAPRMKAIFDDKSIPDDQKWARIRPLRAATDEAIKKVLTPAQQTQYAAQQATARAQRGGGRGGGR